jgi:hypothetical protein
MIRAFKRMFKQDLGPGSYNDLVNIYLVYMGVRSACLIGDMSVYNSVSRGSKLCIFKGLYPGFTRTGFDYPLVCLKGSWVSVCIESMPMGSEFTEPQLGLYLGYNCYTQDWKNLRIHRYQIKYTLANTGPAGDSRPCKDLGTDIYTEICSNTIGAKIRIKFKAVEMTEALKLINKDFRVSCSFNRIGPMAAKARKSR